MIQVKGLTKRFGAFVAVDDVSFEINRGETFALLGPNGIGKSTTLKCIVGLTLPTAGQILVDGLDVRTRGREARQRTSYLPQRVSFHDNLSAREVLVFYCRLRKIELGRIDQVLAESNFNFNGFGDKPVGEFSGGMVQRLGLAVTCLPDAPILVLDEPTLSLDPDGALRFREFLATLKRQGKTIVLASHMLAEVEQLADRVGILVGGKLAAVQSIEALRNGLARTCKMEVALCNPSPQWTETALRAGASAATLEGASLCIASSPEQRLAILRAIESAGGKIASFATRDLALEDIYLRYTSDKIGDKPSGR